MDRILNVRLCKSVVCALLAYLSLPKIQWKRHNIFIPILLTDNLGQLNNLIKWSSILSIYISVRIKQFEFKVYTSNLYPLHGIYKPRKIWNREMEIQGTHIQMAKASNLQSVFQGREPVS